MTYQSPYQPPTGYSNFDYYQPDLLAPARRASLLMFILGGLALLSSLCCVGVGTMVPQLMQQPEFAQRMQSIPNASPEMLRMAFIAMGSISILFAIAMIVLGVFVRRGGKGAIVTALVLNVIAVLLMLVYIAGGGTSRRRRRHRGHLHGHGAARASRDPHRSARRRPQILRAGRRPSLRRPILATRAAASLRAATGLRLSAPAATTTGSPSTAAAL